MTRFRLFMAVLGTAAMFAGLVMSIIVVFTF